MQVEINDEEKAVLASDIKVGDVITWGAHQDYYVKTNNDDSFVKLNARNSGVIHLFFTEGLNNMKDLRIVTDKCKLVVTM